MSFIHVLDESTINQIAAGEVVERPSAVVKELIENAMDAGATAITAEIKEGGLSFIRITDNGLGISKEDIPLAFLRHATSKIRSAEDLLSVTSLGFRGEALSSIAAVAQVELITKTPSALNGFRYLIEGGEEKAFEEIGCPGGTTIIVRNIFFNTPARRKFLKSAMTEAGYVSDLMERLIVSHPNVSFKFIVNNQVKLQSSGNNNCKDILYHIYGRDVSKELLAVESNENDVKVTGYIGKPIITRGNRNFENYFINGRYIKSNIITKAIEEAYKPFMMQHKYPFTSMYFEIDPSLIDVNVHPQKMEIRLKNSEEIYQFTYQLIRNTLTGKEMIPKVKLTEELENKLVSRPIPEPFEQNRRKELGSSSYTYGNTSHQPYHKVAEISTDYVTANGKDIEDCKIIDDVKNIAGTMNITDVMSISDTRNIVDIYNIADTKNNVVSNNFMDRSNITDSNNIVDSKNVIDNKNILESNNASDFINIISNKNADVTKNTTEYIPVNENRNTAESNNITGVNCISDNNNNVESNNISDSTSEPKIVTTEQMKLFNEEITSGNTPFLSPKALEEHRIIGQVFATYWLVEYRQELYIIDQHAAHEKVLFEKIMNTAKSKTFVSQQLMPPIVLTLTLKEQEVLQKHESLLNTLGYEFEHFGGKEYSVRAVPADLYSISEKELLLEFIDEMADEMPGSIANSNTILERVASISCKAAVKANHTLSYEEAAALIRELLTLENPYHCPHGRPVIVSMSQYELERKFKRII